jgi:hypothetical protein
MFHGCGWASQPRSGLQRAGNADVENRYDEERTTDSFTRRDLFTRKVGPKWWEHTDKLPTYVLHMKGSTCIRVKFPSRARFTQAEPIYSVFQRERYRAVKAPVKRVTRYVHPTVVPW